jgi:prevent-host-death family protein
MNISVSEAKTQLTDLVRRAEAGEEIVLTRHGKPTVTLSPIQGAAQRQWSPQEREARYRAIMAISKRAAAKATPGPDAAHSADHLYDDNGLPI